MILPRNHLFLNITNDIAQISKPLRKLGIINFTYMKSFLDGSRIYLDDTPDTVDIYLKGKYYLKSNIECPPDYYKDQVILWSHLPDQKVFDDCLRSRSIDHGIIMFEPHEEHLEMFCFAAKSDNHGVINTYLSNMDNLLNFKNYFREKAAPIIKKAEKNKILLPFNNALMDFTNEIGRIQLPEVRQVNSNIHELLSRRQIECCSLLMVGNTAKEIGTALGISTRTVEFYIQLIKSKLHCRNKAALISKLSRYFHSNPQEFRE